MSEKKVDLSTLTPKQRTLLALRLKQKRDHQTPPSRNKIPQQHLTQAPLSFAQQR